ncbi:MAG TPA: ABC transporter permease [Bryobacteraceae bacterium]|nr:ABC transporter permease [Bryobacteraceae bacterium]
MLKRFRSLFRALMARRDFEQGMGEELQTHIEQYAQDLMHRGIPPEEAARRARIEFGALNSIQEECREARWLRPFDELARQTRYAARLLRKSPGFTIAALLTLGVCLGANLTLFAVIDSVLLRPLPFPHAGRLVTMYNSYPKAGVQRDGSSITNYYERRGRIPAFSGLALYRYGTAIVGDTGSTERQQIVRVSPEFFSTLGTRLAMGRAFTEQETSPGADQAVILTSAYWRQHLNADSHVIGKKIQVDGLPCTVVGVLPADFRFLSSKATLYFPFSSRLEERAPAQRHSGGNSKQLIARLRPGATLAQAQAQIDAQNRSLEADDPQAKMMADAGFRTVLVPLHADHVASVRPTLLLLQAGALTLLLIGVVNLANLLLIRVNGRSKEMAVRQALGASRLQVLSEVAVETTLLTLAGGLLGLLAGAGGIRLLMAFGADRLPLGSQIAFDARLAVVAFLGAIVLGIALALPVAWLALRAHPANGIQSEARGGTASHAAQTLRHGFVVAQIALAFVLLSGAGLLAVSLERVMSTPPGFRPDHVLTGQISLPWSSYGNWPARLAFNATLLREISRQPGVSTVGLVNNLPLSGNSGKSAATVKGHVIRPGESARGHYSYGVDGDYFAAMGIFLREGRFLTADDSRRGNRVCVVDEDFARYYWPHGSALGHKLFEGSEKSDDAQAFTVVGVVGAVKQAGLTDDVAQGAVYYPYAFRTDGNLFVVVRTVLPPESLGPALQNVVRRIDPQLPVNDIRSMDTLVNDSLVAQRSPALLSALFSAIALLLTAVGAYGVLSYAVALRRGEIGVRMALGARPEQIQSQFLILALRLVIFGTTLGIAGAWLTGQAMRSLLFHVSPIDIPVLAWTAGSIAVVSLLACLLPSRRAAHISPIEALRSTGSA